MKPLQIFVVLLLLSNLLYGQNTLYNDAYCVSTPEMDGIFWIRAPQRFRVCHPSPSLHIISNLAEVHSISDGEVTSVVKIAGTYMSMIKKDSLFYVYSNIDTSYVSKGQKIRKGDALGLIGKNDEGQIELTFQVWKSVKNGRLTELDPKPFLHAVKISDTNFSSIKSRRKVAD